MRGLSLNNVLQTFDDLGAHVSVLYFFYALAFVIIFLWIIISFSKSKGLVNHRNAVALRGLVNFLRSADHEQKQINELVDSVTKTPNDVSMLFYMYCRIHNSFGFIEHYLNYKAYKYINKKKKPWGFSFVVMLSVIVTLAFSISYFVGIGFLLDMDMEMTDLLMSIAFPLALFLVWLMFRLLILMKYKMYWVEFENKFRKVHVMCKPFFNSQEKYYEEFSDIILAKLSPHGGTKRRIERIIMITDPDEVMDLPGDTSRKSKKAKDLEEAEANDNINQPQDQMLNPQFNSPFNQPLNQTPFQTLNHPLPFTQMPMHHGHRFPQHPPMSQTPRGMHVLKPHPETEAYLQAQSQITQQLMQMMMQQSMQQSQVVQRALTSQQALANSVVQQNIMAMRLEAQQASLHRPDVATRIAEQTYAAWDQTRDNMMRRPPPVQEEEVAEPVKKSTASKATTNDIVDDIVIEKVASTETIVEAQVIDEMPAAPGMQGGNAQEQPQQPPQPPKPPEFDVNKLVEAFSMLSPPISMDDEPDPIFVAPDREKTNVEKRLEEFFTASVCVYDDIDTEGVI